MILSIGVQPTTTEKVKMNPFSVKAVQLSSSCDDDLIGRDDGVLILCSDRAADLDSGPISLIILLLKPRLIDEIGCDHASLHF